MIYFGLSHSIFGIKRTEYNFRRVTFRRVTICDVTEDFSSTFFWTLSVKLSKCYYIYVPLGQLTENT